MSKFFAYLLIFVCYLSLVTTIFAVTPSAPPFTIEFGRTETVDKSKDHTCVGAYDYYDNTTRAFINNQGQIIFTGTDDQNRYAIGDNLSDFHHQCNSALTSHYNGDPTLFDDGEYLMAPYTLDGTTVYGLLHTEYHGWTHNSCDCPPGNNTCLINCYQYSINLAISTNGGKTFTHSPPPSQNIVHSAIPYSPAITPSHKNYGFSSVSDILKKDGYYYALLTAYTQQSPLDYGVCLMRTQNLANPNSWKFWDGSGYSISAGAQGGSQPRCKNVNGSVSSITSSMSFLYNDYLKKYLSIGNDWGGNNPTTPQAFFSLSSNLTDWTGPYLFSNTNQTNYYAYGTLLQPGDPTRNFELSGRSPWFYYVTCDSGQRINTCQTDPNRTNLMRTRVRFTLPGDENKYDILNLQFNEYRGNKTLDSSFYGNDGIIVGDANFHQENGINYLNFGNNSSVTISPQNNLNVSSTLSIALKLRTNLHPGPNTYPTIITKTGADKRNYGLYLTPEGKLHFSFTSNGQFVGSVSDSAINDGLWHTITIVFSPTNHTTAYVIDDKTSIKSNQNGQLSDGINTDPVVIGGNNWVGDIDYLTLYNYALPFSSSLSGDLNADGKVNIFDYNILVGNFGKTGTNIQGDIDNNGKVDIFDYNVLVGNFGT